MFILVLLVAVAVVSTLRYRTEQSSAWGRGVTGMLSLALGVRVVAVATAVYLWPGVAAIARSDEAEKKPAEALAEVQDSATRPPETSAAAASDSAAGASDSAAAAGITPAPAAATPASILPQRESLKFVTNVRYLTANRPAWVESPPAYDGEAYQVAVKAGPYTTVRECEPDLAREVQMAVADFVANQIKSPRAATVVSYSLDDLRRRHVVREQFSEQLETSLGLMNQVHARLVFDDSVRDDIDRRWRDHQSRNRLTQTGIGTSIVLLLLGTLFSYFKLDTATRGYYTGRLQFAAAGTILTVVAASVLLVKWLVHM